MLKERANQIQNVLNERKGQINEQKYFTTTANKFTQINFILILGLKKYKYHVVLKMDSLPRDLVNVIEDYAKETTNFELMIADLSDWFAQAQRLRDVNGLFPNIQAMQFSYWQC